jgi:hypothetical protein
MLGLDIPSVAKLNDEKGLTCSSRISYLEAG